MSPEKEDDPMHIFKRMLFTPKIDKMTTLKHIDKILSDLRMIS